MGFLQKIFSARQFPFIILTASVVVFTLCINLFQDGMFIDGIQYAAVARNLARGVGTFWNPVLAQNSVAELNSFHEHPPLVFFIQSLFFRVFGMNNIYPERIYCLFTFLATGIFMALIWRRIFKGQRSEQLWWLPVLMWTVMPIVFWAYTNDIQENTMGIFTTAAVYFFISAASNMNVLRSGNFYMGCISILLAAFCKGVPGLFPAVFFFIYWLSVAKINFSQAMKYSLEACVFMGVLILIILQSSEAKEALHTWFFDRMLKRISSDPTEASHFYILKGLLTEQLPAIILAVLVLIIYRLKQVRNEMNRGYFMLFILLGFAGALPLMLTLVQRNFYFIPALPMFAIAWALLIADGLNYTIDSLEQRPKLRKGLTVFVLMAFITGTAITMAYAGKIKRDRPVLEDVYTIKKLVPENSFVSVTSDIMWMDWSFRCYMMRYDEIQFSDKDTCGYFIARPGDHLSDKFINSGTLLNAYTLYKRK